jgi:hypothetical protein
LPGRAEGDGWVNWSGLATLPTGEEQAFAQMLDRVIAGSAPRIAIVHSLSGQKPVRPIAKDQTLSPLTESRLHSQFKYCWAQSLSIIVRSEGG